ncbi:hypothetical protein I4641_12730 [Waterburya agarophytonicola K14]|uniref:Uncharacterized protein n=1 Tax=Waterburya agarophytonicola KI4 TaxID=2874699 RepID=A0A964BTE6_9CYAN|nr:hypothetical protein [Waterburya agarophytonicola]MCC0177842.1 hypothetical protein [Waterburya agarophytonicola KI4]
MRLSLSTNPVEGQENISKACGYATKSNNNSLILRGKGGIPAPPGLTLDSQSISINGATKPKSTIPDAIDTSKGKIQPARGIKVTDSGEIILTAYRTNNSGDRLTQIKRNCI